MKHFDYIILGAGAAGLLTAYRMANDPFFDSASILIIEKESSKANDRTWSFWEKGIGEFDDIVHRRWEYIYFGSHWFSRRLSLGEYSYKTIRSSDFYEKIFSVLNTNENISITYENVKNINEAAEFVEVKTDKEIYGAAKVLNSLDNKSYLKQNRYPVLNQHFLGWFIQTKSDAFDDSAATFMDFDISQNNNTRFMYVLPFSKRDALFEYTLFSEGILKKSEYEKGIRDYLESKGISDFSITEKEYGVIPMTSHKFHENDSKNILNIGTAGGWTKASTGFTFMNSIKKSKRLVTFLKSHSDLRKFHKTSRFWFYDLIFLDVLAKDNAFGAKLFSSMFQKTHVTTILKFLDEESSVFQELKVIFSVPPRRFISAFFKRVFS